MPKSREESKNAFSEVLVDVERLHRWTRAHSAVEFAALLSRADPEQRAQVHAHLSELKNWLTEFADLPPTFHQ
jgi:hypothetical protein